MRILSIQSSVSYGHVGNSAAVFPLQRIGHEVMPIYTVMFSNHTGYGEWGGPLLTGDNVRDVVRGIDARGGLDDVQLVLSGYQGGNDIGDAILDAVALVKARNPEAVYACDPVLGSASSGCFVAPEVQSLIRDRVVPAADLITPNQFELGFLTGTDPHTIDETLASVDLIRQSGRRRCWSRVCCAPIAPRARSKCSLSPPAVPGSCRLPSFRSRRTARAMSLRHCFLRSCEDRAMRQAHSDARPPACSNCSKTR